MKENIRIDKAQESMLAAIQCFNNPFARYREETFLQLALVAWTHLLHQKLENAGVPLTEDNGNYLSLSKCIKKQETGLEQEQIKVLNDLIKLRNDVVHDGSKATILSREYSKLTNCAVFFEKYLESFGFKLKLGDVPFYAISLTKLTSMDEKQRENLNNLIDCDGGDEGINQKNVRTCYVERPAPPSQYFRATQIVEKINNKITTQIGIKNDSITKYHFIKIWQTLEAKGNLEYGRFVTDQEKEWIWNDKWVEIVKQIVLRYLIDKKKQKVDVQLNSDQEKELKDLGQKYRNLPKRK